MREMTPKQKTMAINTYQQVIGYFYYGLNKLCNLEVLDIDASLQELLELQMEEYVDAEVLSNAQVALRSEITNALGVFAVRASAEAMKLLEEKSQGRDGLDPEYTEIFL